MGTPDIAAGMRAFCTSITSPTGDQTDVRRVRDGLQIAIDGLSMSDRDCHMRRILTAFHWLLGPLTQQEIADNVDDVVESAEWLADYYGPADAEPNCDASYEYRRDA